MTLLSIREQEAVNGGLSKWMASHARSVNDALTGAHLLNDHDKALILATRDAIARQVREENERLDAMVEPEDRLREDTLCSNTWEQVATFIEGLE